ncbi:alpha/beta hydrolase [Teredinibacter turnerae]|uniref:alpha/beta fold hydrolase n=1 Tax=Teredinibacter turnerae TaxID=2426 RepID=UPI0003620E0A|nr:alpha/beta hydrolase [Teredinibacter turnerae]
MTKRSGGSRWLQWAMLSMGLTAIAPTQADLLDVIAERVTSSRDSDGSGAIKISPVNIRQIYKQRQQAAQEKGNDYTLTEFDEELIATDRWRYFTVRNTVFDSDVFVLEAGDVNKPTMILVHGLGQNGLRDWLNVIPRFEKEYHIIALDLPGFGLSPTTEGEYSPTNYATVVHQVAGVFGAKRYVLIGHSMGGAVALRYAADYGDELQQLVLVDAAGILYRTAYLKHAVEFPAELYGLSDISVKLITGVEELGQALIETVTSLPDAVHYIRKFRQAWNKTLGLNPNVNAATALVYEDFASAAHETRVPTSIIWGADDGVAPLRTGVMLNDTLEKSRLHSIANCGHTPMRVKPAQFNALLAEVLASPPPQNPPSLLKVSAQAEKLVIEGETNQFYSGEYSEVEIRDSTAIHLQNLSAKRIKVTDSSVNLENVYLAADTTAMIAVHAIVDGTNVTMAANSGILADDSRIDLANATLIVDHEAINVGDDSQIILSASQVVSPGFTGYVHGQYRTENATIDFKKKGLQ